MLKTSKRKARRGGEFRYYCEGFEPARKFPSPARAPLSDSNTERTRYAASFRFRLTIFFRPRPPAFPPMRAISRRRFFDSFLARAFPPRLARLRRASAAIRSTSAFAIRFRIPAEYRIEFVSASY